MKTRMDPVTVFTTDKEKTFEHQGSLPSLPIPKLKHTLDRYLDSVRPLVSNDEYRRTERFVRQFENADGKELHQKLMERAKHQRNWLERWWDDKAYLEFRLPIAPLMNVAGPTPFGHTWLPREGTQTQRAAMWIYFAMDYWTLLRKERLKPDRNNKGRVLSMNQYHRCFNTCRIPGQKKDQLLSYFKTESEGDCPSHVAVLCHGRIYVLETHHSNGERLTAPEIESQLNRIRGECDGRPWGPGVGALTGDNRTTWAKMRNKLISLHPENWENLKKIETAVVVVALDESSPKNADQVVHGTLGGDSKNRWCDKSYTFIVYQNGLTAANCDHTPFEGTILVASLNYVDLSLKHCGGKWRGTSIIRELPSPIELTFHLDQEILNAIEKASQMYKSLSDSIEVRVQSFEEYGKVKLRKFRLHPDTHVQLAIQYAYLKTYGRPAPTYETATTRQFFNGRTETMRSCTSEALEWSKAMLDHNMSSQQRRGLYLKAADKHNQLMQEAQSNQGCDRHLFGLMCLAEEDNIPLPQIFTDPSFQKSGGGANFILSTSFLGYTPVHGVVAPMCENGYCVAYSIQENQINCVTSAWVNDTETDSHRFTDVIHQCLQEMGQLLHTADMTARL